MPTMELDMKQTEALLGLVISRISEAPVRPGSLEIDQYALKPTVKVKGATGHVTFTIDELTPDVVKWVNTEFGEKAEVAKVMSGADYQGSKELLGMKISDVSAKTLMGIQAKLKPLLAQKPARGNAYSR